METIIFGGTFDPPTHAHEAVIRACLEADPAADVWVMPSGARRDKCSPLDDKDRTHMVHLMIDEAFTYEPRLRISRLELDNLPRPTQTWDTVQALKKFFPRRHFRFVFGADSYQSMPAWPHGEELQASLDMLVLPRGNLVIPVVPNVTELKIDVADETSSTEVRRRVAAGKTIAGLVCGSVDRYIRATGLYRTPPAGVQ